MGVPFYYRYLTKRYSGIAKQFRRHQVQAHFQQHPAESLCLDLNGIIHNAAQEVYLYGSNETTDARRLAKLKATPKPDLQRRHLEAVTTQITNLLKLVRPRYSLIIGVDGPAPLSKQYQQKQRRFKAKSVVLEERTAEEYISYETKPPTDEVALFDSNSITPGTEFMEALHQYLLEWIDRERARLPYHVIYSGHRSPGEGEHKIAQYLRTIKFPARGANNSHVVYGLDADLIMLGLLSPQKHYTLLRDDITDVGESFHLLHVNALRTRLVEHMGSVADYVLLTFLAGNDFLPAFPSISIGSEGIDKLVELYRQLRGKRLIRADSHRLDWVVLREFMTLFAQAEPRLLEEQARRGSKYPSIALEQAVKNQKLDINRFYQAYYERSLGLKSSDVAFYPEALQDARPVAEEWLAGLAWVYKYYNEGMEGVNVEWQYHYNYVPLAQEIVSALQSPSPQIEWQAVDVVGRVLHPFEQLLSVLPPASAGLIPASIRSLLTDPQSPLADLYPQRFLADLNGKMKDHEAVALIPFIDSGRVRAELTKFQFSPAEEQLNTFEVDLIDKLYRLP